MSNDDNNNKIDKPLIKSENLFPVVGIGASAGGLDAFKKLLKAIPENSGMAYVLVQHLHPEHESFLTDILQKVTPIPVLEISDDIKVESNHIYIIPSNKMLIANDGKLELSPRPAKSKNKPNLPIDLFFASLAIIHQSHAIGVVLSGTGADGTLGLKAIKDNGGITIVQNIESAEYNGMPANAIQANVVDFILTPEEIPLKLLDIISQINLTDEELKNLPPHDEDVFKQILTMLRIRKGTDFTYYKQTTIRRRILRRMAINKNEEPAVYLKYLKENKPEQDLLYQDLLIPVTSFFRDSKVFDSLCQTVFPTVIKNKLSGAPIRLWVTACSTGQEAYSMAMCLKEYLGNTQERAQIFATDISEPAIAKARLGIYTKEEVTEVSSQRLQDFFTKTDGGYRLNKDIREMCIFAVHNFLKDPPFGKIDFVSCRNVLIYMEPYLQKKALTTFHYSLNPKGFLLLGKSETNSSVPDLFLAVGKNERIFTRKDAPGSFIHLTTQRREHNFNEINSIQSKEIMQTDFKKTADDIMLSKYTPAGVVVDDAMDIVYFRGNTNTFLEQSPGKPTHNLLKMAKNGLAFELRNIIHKAKKENIAVTKDNIPIQINGNQRIISIEAIPLPNVVEPHFLILFHGNEFSQNNQQLFSNAQSSSKLKKDEKDLYIQQLERELAQTREDMRSITEDQEAANEELQSANEELLSGSEELQSLNEELETSKEEMQSSNEELTVVNQELISLNLQVTTAQQYAESIISTIREPLLVLDKNLRVKTANKAFYKLFDVTQKETEGTLLYKIGNGQWDIPSLRTLLEEIITEKDTFTDFEVEHYYPYVGKKILLLNAREIKGEAGAENMILLVMEDVTEQKKYQLQDDAFLGRFKNILLQSAVGVAVFKGLHFHVEMANEMFLTIAGKQEKEFVGKPLFETMPETRKFLEPILMEIFQTGIPHNGNEIEYTINSNDKKTLGYYNYTYQPMHDKDGNISGIIGVVNDVTELVNARKKVEQSELFSRNIIENSPDCVKILDDEGHLNFVNNNGLCLLEIDDFASIKNKYWWQIWGIANQQMVKEAVEKAKAGEKVQFQAFQETAKGTPKWWDVIVLPLQVTNESIKASHILSVSRDITEQIIAREKNLEMEHLHTKELEEKVQLRTVELSDANQLLQTINIEKEKRAAELVIANKKLSHESREKENRAAELIIANKELQFQNAEKEKRGNELAIANKELLAFNYISSHDLQEPLRKIQTFATLIAEKEFEVLSEQGKDYFHRMEEAARHMQMLIVDLLTYSRTNETGRKFEKTDLNKILKDVLYDMSEFLKQKNAVVELKDICEVYVIPFQMRQLITNLINNAVKFTAKNVTPYVIITCKVGKAESFANEIAVLSDEKLLPQSEYCRITFKDNGIGFDPQYRNKIFEIFQRLHNKESYKGTGIGLAIVKKIVQNHNGIITAEGKLNEGATFYIYLPVL